MSIPKHVKEHSVLGITENAFSFFKTTTIKLLPIGVEPPFDVDANVAQGNSTYIANKIWFYPFIMPHKGDLDIINLGLGAGNTAGTADTVRIGIYDADTGALALETSISFTVGAASLWVNTPHFVVGDFANKVPQRCFLAVYPELSTNTSANSTIIYAATSARSNALGSFYNFTASGNPAATTDDMSGSGYYSVPAVSTLPFSFPATLPNLGGSVFVTTNQINMSGYPIAARVGIRQPGAT